MHKAKPCSTHIITTSILSNKLCLIMYLNVFFKVWLGKKIIKLIKIWMQEILIPFYQIHIDPIQAKSHSDFGVNFFIV